jgi:hypothetical protein
MVMSPDAWVDDGFPGPGKLKAAANVATAESEANIRVRMECAANGLSR